MRTQDIADRFVSLCRQGQFETAQRELFSAEVVSTEPYGTPTFPQETVGLPALLEKAKKFTALIAEVHGVSVSEPLVAGNAFVVAMKLEVTLKTRGRQLLDELCLYKVDSGKIVSERFTARFPV